MTGCPTVAVLADVFEVAERALSDGWSPVVRSAYRQGSAYPVAVDVVGGFAAVLVIGFDGADWVLDIVRYELVDGNWRALGGGGGRYGNLPFEAVPGEAPGLALVSRSYGESDDSRVWAAGGFVLGDVQSVELSVGGLARRVAIGPEPKAFVAVIAEMVDDDGDPDMDLVVVRAFDSAGDLVDDSSRWSKPGLADGTLAIAEALLQPAGSVVTVRGVLLALVARSRICNATL